MADKKKVYVETSDISYLTARPSRDILNNARQLITKDWWTVACDRYSLFVSELVEQESQKGDQEAAKKRMEIISKDTIVIKIDAKVYELAERLLIETAVPRTSFDDAVHIATAAISGMDYLVSWNCKHIANPETKPLIRATCESMGYHYPEIFTPYEIGG